MYVRLLRPQGTWGVDGGSLGGMHEGAGIRFLGRFLGNVGESVGGAGGRVLLCRTRNSM